MTGVALIWTTVPDENSAREIVNSLLDERLIACANIFGEHLAMFVWDGAQHEARETGMLLKLDAAGLEAAIARLQALHPYEMPVIVGWHGDAAARPTLDWLASVCLAVGQR